MLSYQVTKIHVEFSKFYKSDCLYIIYVTDGEALVFQNSMSSLNKLSNGHFTIVTFDDYAFLDCTKGSATILEMNWLLFNTLASDFPIYMKSYLYSALPYFNERNELDCYLYTLEKHSPYEDTKLSIDISHALISVIHHLYSRIMWLHQINDYYEGYAVQALPYRQNEKLQRLFEATLELCYNQDKSISEIALDLDYYDQAHFTKDFKQYRNMTPHEFRKLFISTRL